MLDIKLLRTNPDAVRNMLQRRRKDSGIVDEILGVDEKRRETIKRSDELKNTRNVESKHIGQMKQKGEDITEQSEKVRQMADEIKALDETIKELDTEMDDLLSGIPNMPAENVPSGESEADNVEVRRWGELKKFEFQPKPHWDLGEALDIIDIPRAVKMATSRFTMMKGQGALLERALINFMLDVHTQENGYTEIVPPVLVNSGALYGTGQLPKFEEDLFKTTNGMYLIPTAEVSLTNIHAGEIMDAAELPKYYCGFTPCFRSEAGAAGKDTRGLIRVHQFNKVELVKICEPEKSFDELELMTATAESILRKLDIPYRVMLLNASDLGFSSALSYDLEYWAPGLNRWVEVSSCSNCTDFQARRANIKFKEKGGKPRLVHTLNGSGLAVGRTLVAVMENYQNEDGSITVPEALRPYMNGLDVIGKKDEPLDPVFASMLGLEG